ncbi:FAD-dependent monooxygenase [Rhodococcus spongiicola]|uniref:FAD-dependent oxidoreductase n=1 Tax=Rhodococcus spongiicola TaxID=2487352 RepID=A0A3S3AC10_9NOCA|nr:FAD-dependent monooxygenase [Rhodococcus spongiicola]RVW04500.1 FAD-dependent oxidoreductase [Rhodococcus spongiicola]
MKALVCGAGLAGLTLAHRLSVLGVEVVLLERAPGPRTQGYMIDFLGPGYDTAEAMGLLPAVREVAYYLEEATMVDEGGHRRASLPMALLAPGPRLDVMRPDLERVLRESLPPSVELRFGVGPVAVEDRGGSVRVILDDSSELDVDLLVGADGLHSTVRRLTFGDESEYLRYLGFHTAAFTFPDDELNEALAGRFWMTDTVDRLLGLYALRDKRVAVFAIHRSPDPTVPDDPRAALRETYSGMGWLVPQILSKLPSPSEIYYDQVAQVLMPNWCKGRVVLVGDACFAVSVLAGQGASMAMGGAYVLADRLSRTASIEQALSGYEKLWRPVVERTQRQGRWSGGFFVPGSQRWLLARRAVLRALQLPIIDQVASAAAARAGEPIDLIPVLHRSQSTAAGP